MDAVARYNFMVSPIVYILCCAAGGSGVTISRNVEEQFTPLQPESPTITAVRGNSNGSF